MSTRHQHQVIVFFGLTYLISWGLWWWVNGTGQPLSGWVGLVALLGAFGPAIAGLVCAGLFDGRAGLWALLKRLLAWRVHWAVYLAVLVGPVLLVFVPVLLNQLLGAPAPYWAALRQWTVLLPTAARMLLIGGLTEEPGWRGFALPALRRQYGPLASSLVLGLVWGVWHVPIYSWPGLGNPIPPESLVVFVLGTVPLTVFFTALAERCGHSVLIAMLFHAATNTIIYGLPDLLRVAQTDQMRFLSQLTWFGTAAIIAWFWARPASVGRPRPLAPAAG
jgi:membrane protease YdiL (CAAX protease family)